MTLKFKTDKTETLLHLTIKSMTMYLLRKEGHKADMEVNLIDSIIDVYDYSSNIAYEIQNDITPGTLAPKVSKLLRHTEVKDVVIIPLKVFNLDMTIRETEKKLKAYIN